MTPFKTRLISNFAFTALFATTFWGCKKPAIETPNAVSSKASVLSSSFVSNNFVFGPDNATTGYRYTELGRHYGPVFEVQNVTDAWNQLSSRKIGTLAPTHLYIKFTPHTAEELKAVTDADIPVYTFPLDYEITSSGDYMQDPAGEPNGMPPLYTCLPADVTAPNCPYELISKLYLLDLRSVVAKKAFELAGEGESYPGMAEEGEKIPGELLTTSNDISTHLNRTIEWKNNRSIVLPPSPVDPVNPAININNPPSTVVNACACNNSSDDRQPSGCIKVEETQWYNGNVVFEGVNDVMADFIGPFFQRLSPMTDANGCYKSDFKIRYKVWTPFGTIRLPVIMSTIFASGKKSVKGLNHNGNMFEYALPMTHCIWSVQGGGLNNVNISYLRDWNTEHNETKYYTCATVNNALYDYDGYCNQDGILKSPDNLKVLVHKYSEASAAPMFDKLLMSGSIPTTTAAAFVLATSGAIPGVGGTGIGELIVLFPPDVLYGYNLDNKQVQFSTDQVKEVAYHEFSHTSHYRKAGNSLWEKNVFYVATHNGYGNAGDNGSERTDLIEMWAYYNGRDLVHRRYGPNKHSLGTLHNTSTNFHTSWYAENEQTINDWGHISSGFLQDIRDDNAYNIANGLAEAYGINDKIHGFSKSTIFNLLGSGTVSASSLITQLGTQIPSGSTSADYTILKGNYGY